LSDIDGGRLGMKSPWKIVVIGALFFVTGCSSILQENGAPELGAAAVGTVEQEPLSETAIEKLLADGQTALEVRNHARAQENFSRVLENDKNNVEALLGVGESLLIAGQTKQALGAFIKAGKLSDGNARVLQGQGLALLAMGNVSSAHEAFEKAVALDPELWRAWNALGAVKDRLDLWKEARQAYDRASGLNPDAVGPLNNKGISYLLEKKYSEAESEFQRALQRFPDSEKLRSNFRIALAWQGKYAEALSGVKKSDMPSVLNNIGYIAMKRGDYEFAEAYLSQALQTSPSYYKKAAENLYYLNQIRKVGKKKKDSIKLSKENKG
jgi:Flp pilus assembly protein TadD